MLNLLQSGLGNLAAYLAAHVLLCLLPAFLIAGGLSALVPKGAITRFLGRRASKMVSYPAAAAAGSLLAVCSCTIVPLFAGIYKKGAGLGPAITFLFFAPAANILALAYTGVALGPDLAIARLVLSLAFGIGIGMIMALVFRHEELAREPVSGSAFDQRAGLPRRTGIFMGLLVALLLAGTLKLGFLTRTYTQFDLPISSAQTIQDALYRLVPFDSTRGEEGVTLQGVLLIGLLVLIGVSAWLGLRNILDGYNRWTWVALSVVALTLLVASLSFTPTARSLTLGVTGRTLAVGVLLAALAVQIFTQLDESEVQSWLWESWRFVRQIFPLLVVGVFAVGVIRHFIRPEWIETLAGQNKLTGNLAGVFFGVFMYFPTLVEVPIANMFLNLGMHRGPLLAYLMSDPELSLQAILIITAIIGRRKTWTYVALVALFSTLAGLIYGSWVDGASPFLLGGYLLAALALLAFGLYLIDRRQAHRRILPGMTGD